MKKVILNKCFGGFSLSSEAYKLYGKKKGFEVFCYKLDGVGRYIKEKANTNSICYTYFTKDLGDKFREHDMDDNYYEKYNLYLDKNYREDPILIEVVEELKERANTSCSNLKVVEIPDDLDYVIDEYDGIETLHAKVQEW